LNQPSLLPVTVLIMCQNEAPNIGPALDSVVHDFDQVIVTDSYSTDGTLDVVRTFPGVEVHEHTFLNWADQRNWMLENCQIRNEVVYFLDADEYVKPAFVAELRDILDRNVPFDSIELWHDYIFLGKSINHAYGHPWVGRIFKREGLKFRSEGAREYANKKGTCIRMKNPYIHHDRKPLTAWLEKHIRNADREAAHYLGEEPFRFSSLRGMSRQGKIRLLVRHYLYDKLPLPLRPFFYFVYRYFVKMGFLDGLAGLTFCYLHAFWYHSLIGIKIWERRIDEKTPEKLQ